MTIYCKIVNGVIVARERKDFSNPRLDEDGQPIPMVKMVDGKPVWRELIEAGARPLFDSATHHKPEMVEMIESTQVVQSWIAAVAKTQGEISSEAARAKFNAIEQADRPNSFQNLVLRRTFEQENRILILEGKSSITWAQFKGQL